MRSLIYGKILNKVNRHNWGKGTKTEREENVSTGLEKASQGTYLYNRMQKMGKRCSLLAQHERIRRKSGYTLLHLYRLSATELQGI